MEFPCRDLYEKFYGIDDNKKNIVDYKENFVLDKWLLRESFGIVSNNSFAKAKKKMTVKKDLDLRIIILLKVSIIKTFSEPI